MSRLLSLEMVNFKCFRHETVSFGDITVLTGLNGMGKSSVVQAMLLLRQSFESRTPSGRLLLSGPLVDLGTGSDVFFDLAEEDLLLLACEFGERLSNLYVRSEFQFRYDKLAESLRPLGRPGSIPPFQVMVTDGNGGWREGSVTELPKSGRALRNPLLSGSKFQYLSAERLGPRKVLPSSEEQIRKRSLGAQGEFVLSYLARYGEEVLEADDPRIRETGESRTLLGQVESWLQETSPGTLLEVRALPVIDAVTARYAHARKGDVPSRPFRPTNVGFGLSYVLPVLTALLGAKEGDLVVIENPEAHLHPRGQTRLGQLSARAAAAGVQVIIETHSDHFLDGLRIDVRERRLGPERTTIHYFTRSGADTTVLHPALTSDGRVTEWPEGFFDERDENLVRLLAPQPVGAS